MNTENIKAFAEKHSEFLKDIGQSLIVIVTAVIFAVILGKHVFLNANIPSASMENTIMTGDKLIANRLYYNILPEETLSYSMRLILVKNTLSVLSACRVKRLKLRTANCMLTENA